MLDKIFYKFMRDTGFTGRLVVEFLPSTMNIKFAHNDGSDVKLNHIWDKIIDFCKKYGVMCIEIVDISKIAYKVKVSPWDKYGFNNIGGIKRYLFLKEDIDTEDIDLMCRYLKYILESELVEIDFGSKTIRTNKNFNIDKDRLKGFSFV